MKSLFDAQVFLYFLIASLSVAVSQPDPTPTALGWFRWIAAPVIAGLVAVKAKISPQPDAALPKPPGVP